MVIRKFWDNYIHNKKFNKDQKLQQTQVDQITNIFNKIESLLNITREVEKTVQNSEVKFLSSIKMIGDSLRGEGRVSNVSPEISKSLERDMELG